MREHRLIFEGGNPETGSSGERVDANAKVEKMEPLDPVRTEQMDKERQGRLETVAQHEKVENEERDKVLPAIEKEIQDLPDKDGKNPEKRQEEGGDRRNERNERQVQEAERFVNESRDTLKDPYQKEIFDAAMDALSPQEKADYYRDAVVWFNACDKQDKPSSLTPADIQGINQRVFAQEIVFSSFEYKLQKASGLQQTQNAARADYQLNISEADRGLANKAHDKMVQAAKKYLQDHPDVAQIIERQQKEDERKFNERASDERVWGKDGTAMKGHKSPEEMKRDAAKELQTIIDQVNGKKGIKFELQPATQEQKESGEQLSLHIIPKDQRQSVQVQEVTGRVVGLFEKDSQGFPKKAETLKVTTDAQTLKECIASVVTHDYTEKKKSK